MFQLSRLLSRLLPTPQLSTTPLSTPQLTAPLPTPHLSTTPCTTQSQLSAPLSQLPPPPSPRGRLKLRLTLPWSTPLVFTTVTKLSTTLLSTPLLSALLPTPHLSTPSTL